MQGVRLRLQPGHCREVQSLQVDRRPIPTHGVKIYSNQPTNVGQPIEKEIISTLICERNPRVDWQKNPPIIW